MKKIIQQTILSLEKFNDPKRIEFNRRTCPSAMKSIGVTVPNLRIIFKKLKQQMKSFSPEEKIQLAIGLVNTDIHECQSLAYGLIGEDKKVIPALKEKDIEAYTEKLGCKMLYAYFYPDSVPLNEIPVEEIRSSKSYTEVHEVLYNGEGFARWRYAAQCFSMIPIVSLFKRSGRKRRNLGAALPSPDCIVR